MLRRRLQIRKEIVEIKELDFYTFQELDFYTIQSSRVRSFSMRVVAFLVTFRTPFTVEYSCTILSPEPRAERSESVTASICIRRRRRLQGGVYLPVIPAQVHGPRPGSYSRSCCAQEEGEAKRPRCRAGERRRARQAASVWRLRSRPQARSNACPCVCCRNRGAEATRAGSLAPLGGIAAVGKGKMQC
jgi:hypothetical protein